jgi:translation initiation factor IF-3
LNRPFSPRSQGPSNFTRVNGKIRAREVRVIGVDGKQLGVLTLSDAINMARANGVDLVEVSSNATPPVCRLVDFGKYRYELAKREKESKKHQHANRVKEVQLSANIDPHDFGVKLNHAIGFLCNDMKVKITLRFRGRELAHKEIGFQQVEKFIKEVAPWAHPDAPAKLVGRGINLMISPLPRAKRAKNPNESAERPDDGSKSKESKELDDQDQDQDQDQEQEQEQESVSSGPATRKTVSRGTNVEWQLEFKLAYPVRAGDPNWRGAWRAANARIAEGHSPDEFIAGARRYAEFVRETGKAKSEYVQQASRFLGPAKPFLEPWHLPSTKAEIAQDANITASQLWLREGESA